MGASIVRFWNDAENFLISLLATGALTLVCFAVAIRYFLPQYAGNFDWSNEFIIYFIAWSVMLAGSSLVEEGQHIRADIIINLLPARTQKILEVINLVTGLLFVSFLFWYGLDVVQLAHQLGERSDSSALFPIWIYDACLPTGMALMICRYTRRLYLLLLAHQQPEAKQT